MALGQTRSPLTPPHHLSPQTHCCEGVPYEEIDNCTWVLDGDCSTVRLVALPHADRPGYREEWRP
jgi:hypothetical protein